MYNVRRVLTGIQKCRFKYFKARLVGRMSGEVTTSLGNGFTNLMAMAFLAHENGWPELDGFVEGDDGLFRVDGPLPTQEQWQHLGFLVKTEVHDQLGESTFCQIVFDQNDPYKSLSVSPLKSILNCCWTDSKFRNTRRDHVLLGLLKAKVLSLEALAGNNPVIFSFGKRILELVGDVKPIFEDEKYKLIRFGGKFCEPTLGMRLLCERVWGLTLAEQAYCERYFARLPDLGPINDRVVFDIFNRLNHGTCSDYAFTHVRDLE